MYLTYNLCIFLSISTIPHRVWKREGEIDERQKEGELERERERERKKGRERERENKKERGRERARPQKSGLDSVCER